MSSLEGFSEHIRGRRSLVIGEVADWLSKIGAVESESLYKGRSILVIHEAVRGGFSGGPALFRKRWDCIFRIRDSFEAQMLAGRGRGKIYPERYGNAGQPMMSH